MLLRVKRKKWTRIGGHGRVVEGENVDGEATVDLGDEVESRELWVLCKDGRGEVYHHQVEEQ